MSNLYEATNAVNITYFDGETDTVQLIRLDRQLRPVVLAHSGLELTIEHDSVARIVFCQPLWGRAYIDSAEHGDDRFWVSVYNEKEKSEDCFPLSDSMFDRLKIIHASECNYNRENRIPLMFGESVVNHAVNHYEFDFHFDCTSHLYDITVHSSKGSCHFRVTENNEIITPWEYRFGTETNGAPWVERENCSHMEMEFVKEEISRFIGVSPRQTLWRLITANQNVDVTVLNGEEEDPFADLDVLDEAF